MKNMERTDGRARVPTTLSDLPTIPTKIDLDRTIPMEPIILAQLCAQTQVSERRRTLARGLEYSVHLQPAVELPAPAPVVAAAVEDGAAEKSARQSLLKTQRRQTIMLIVGPFIGLSLGMSVAWLLDLGRPAVGRTPKAATVTSRGSTPTPAAELAAQPKSAERPSRADGSATGLPTAPVVGATNPPASGTTAAVAGGPPTAPAAGPLTKSATPTTIIFDPELLTALPAEKPAEENPPRTLARAAKPAAVRGQSSGGRQPALARSVSVHSGPTAAEPVTPNEEREAQLPAELPAAAPPPSETTALPPTRTATAKPVHPTEELDLGRTPKLLIGPKPRLPMMVRQMYRHESVVGNYRICVQPGGGVASVAAVAGIPFDDEIRRVLQTWRFAPRATPTCFEQELHFEVDE